MIWADRLALVWAFLVALVLAGFWHGQAPPHYGHWIDLKPCTQAQIANGGSNILPRPWPRGYVPCGDGQAWIVDQPTQAQIAKYRADQAAIPGLIFKIVLLVAGVPWAILRGLHFVLTGRIGPRSRGRWGDKLRRDVEHAHPEGGERRARQPFDIELKPRRGRMMRIMIRAAHIVRLLGFLLVAMLGVTAPPDRDERIH